MKQLKQLVEKIDMQVKNNGLINVLELQSLVKEYSGKDWQKYVKSENNIAEDCILLQNEQVKVALIYWTAYRKSKKHGHPSGGGLMKLLSGKLIETRFDTENPDIVIGKYHYTTESMAYIHDRLAYHIVENPSEEPAVSLHVSSPGITDSMVVEDNDRSLGKAA